MDYPIQSAAQLRSHLRALRRACGLSQAQLGALLGVGQTRVTRIERDPAAISVEQFLGVLGALRVQMVLRPIGSGSRLADEPAAAGSRERADPGSEPW
jgi:HTH-type transcriptional regulator / antitoxin HipB